ncbi:uncharacterized protein LOC117107060 [Anneissia japonica]|uniref:uncharacterized protein LOC117107060 n=1 Tax=Anneissia japonica TaxID=1529436 RepID=UPI001425724A|nr:uncharacterized protein LOC117107060 [Anneissia japonica]
MANQNDLSGSLCEYDNKKSKTGKERYFSLENNLLTCFRKKKEKKENKDPKYSLDIQECKNIELQKGKHDNILCIEHKDKTFFLIATRKEEINRWYDALSRLCNNSDVGHRPRLRTEPSRPRNLKNEPTNQHLSSPSFDNFLNDSISNEVRS